MLFYLFTIVVLLIIERLFIGKFNFFINYIKEIASNSVEILLEMSVNLNSNDNSNIEPIGNQDENEVKKYFEFVRVRCKNLNTDNKILHGILQNDDLFMSYSVPSKRSGHRAVCDDDNLWIWGGYCPLENNNQNPNSSPMLPEVN